jgi:putative Ca2+/H+ antiporter (TMEM165/GDT1 family)
MKWIVAISFFGFGLWALKPDKLDENKDLRGTGVFVTTLIAFFLVEMGDKTQLATIALAARYDSLVSVVMGTTLGMMIANVPAVWVGEKLTHKINMKVMHWIAAALFIVLGVLTLLAPVHGVRP